MCPSAYSYIPHFLQFIYKFSQPSLASSYKYKYLNVCKIHWVHTGSKRKIFQNSIPFIILSLIVGLTLDISSTVKNIFCPKIVWDRKDSMKALITMDIYVNLSIFNPFNFLSVIVFFLHSLFLPVGYLAIYIFRKQKDFITSGLTDKSRNNRNNRNVAKAKIATIIWLSEVCSDLVMIPQNGTVWSILHYSGIEVNRKTARGWLQEMFKDSNKNGQMIATLFM